VAPTQQCLEQLQQCGGSVSHIVMPNNSPEHTEFAPAWAGLFPDAKIWAPPGTMAGRCSQHLLPDIPSLVLSCCCSQCMFCPALCCTALCISLIVSPLTAHLLRCAAVMRRRAQAAATLLQQSVQHRSRHGSLAYFCGGCKAFRLQSQSLLYGAVLCCAVLCCAALCCAALCCAVL
jgi:hypothetical protein